MSNALDYDVVEHTPNKRGDGSRFLEVHFRPTVDDIAVLGRGGVHSNHFWMQLPETGIRVVMDAGRLVTRSGRRVRPDAEGMFPDENPADPWLREEFARDVIAEYEANIKRYWERKLRAASEGRFYPQHHRTTLNLQVGASADDARQDSGDVVLVIATTDITDAVTEHHGHRFQNVTIPNGATIDSAIFSVYISATTADEPKHQVRAEAADDAALFTTAADSIDSRSRTTATTQWNSTGIGVAAAGFQQWGCTTDGGAGTSIAAVVKEVTDRAGWGSGQALVLIYEQHTSTDATRDLGVNFYDNNTAQAAKLDIDYTAGGGAAVVPLRTLMGVGV